MTQMFENFVEQRENPLKSETTAQSKYTQAQHPVNQPVLTQATHESGHMYNIMCIAFACTEQLPPFGLISL